MELYRTTEWSKSFSAEVLYLQQRNFSAPLHNLECRLNTCVRQSPILREEHTLAMFQNRMLRNIFGPIRDELIRYWRILNNELKDLHFSPDIFQTLTSRRMNWRGMWNVRDKTRGAYWDLVDRSEGMRPFVTRKRISEYNIRKDFQEIFLQIFAWIYQAQAKNTWRVLVNTFTAGHLNPRRY